MVAHVQEVFTKLKHHLEWVSGAKAITLSSKRLMPRKMLPRSHHLFGTWSHRCERLHRREKRLFRGRNMRPEFAGYQPLSGMILPPPPPKHVNNGTNIEGPNVVLWPAYSPDFIHRMNVWREVAMPSFIPSAI